MPRSCPSCGALIEIPLAAASSGWVCSHPPPSSVQARITLVILFNLPCAAFCGEAIQTVAFARKPCCEILQSLSRSGPGLCRGLGHVRRAVTRRNALCDCRFLRSRGRANCRNSRPSGAPEGLINSRSVDDGENDAEENLSRHVALRLVARHAVKNHEQVAGDDQQECVLVASFVGDQPEERRNHRSAHIANRNHARALAR